MVVGFEMAVDTVDTVDAADIEDVLSMAAYLLDVSRVAAVVDLDRLRWLIKGKEEAIHFCAQLAFMHRLLNFSFTCLIVCTHRWLWVSR